MQEMSTKGFELGKAAGERVAQKYKTEIEENVRKMQSTPGATPAASNPK